jgi:hypothetical protein
VVLGKKKIFLGKKKFFLSESFTGDKLSWDIPDNCLIFFHTAIKKGKAESLPLF